MFQTRHTGPPNNPQPPPPNPGGQFSGGPMAVINESCDRIKKEFDALQAANHSLRMEIEKLHSEKSDVHKHFIMYYEMSYGLHLDVCKQKEIAKRLNNIIVNIVPLCSNEQQAQIATMVDRAKQVSPEELNAIVDQQMRENFVASEMNPMAGFPGLGRPLPGTPGLPGLPGPPPHGPPMHPGLPHGLPPHSMPPLGPPMQGLPPQGLVQPGLSMSSPPNAAGLLAMSGTPGLPGLGPGMGGLPGMPGVVPPPHMMPKDGPPTSRNNPIPNLDNQIPNNNNNNIATLNNNTNPGSNNTFNNHQKPPRNSIDSERRAASSSSTTSDRDGHGLAQLETKHHSSKKHRRNEETSHSQPHQVMMTNSSSISDDEKSEDLVVDGDNDRICSPNSHHNGSTSPRENGGASEWNQTKIIKKERPLSRASSVTSGCGPSNRERASPKTVSHKAKSSPSTLPPGPMPGPLGPLGPGPAGLPPNPMIPGIPPGYGRPMFPIGPIGPDGMPVPPLGPGGVKIPFGPLSEPYSIQLDPEGQPKFIPCSPRALADPAVPKKAREVFSLDHGEVVCAVALSNPTRNIYTGGKGFVKVWSLDNSESNNEIRAPKVIQTPVAELACLPPDAYVRSCKLLPDGKKLIVGGEVPPISLWDLGEGGPVKVGELKGLATACYALGISPDSKTCITCFSDGQIGLYDVHNLQLIGKFQGHEDGASCIDISSDGNTLWTGGLDTTLKSWNLGSNKIVGEKDYVSKTKFNSQIFSLGCCPTGDYIAVGMENSIIEVMSTTNKPEKMQLKMHDSCVLALKFAASGKWFISTGKDKLLNLCGSPAINCPQIMKVSLAANHSGCNFDNHNMHYVTEPLTISLSHYQNNNIINPHKYSSRKILQFYLAILVAMINTSLQVQEKRKQQYTKSSTDTKKQRIYQRSNKNPFIVITFLYINLLFMIQAIMAYLLT